ncbi:MAG: hypothetical protein WD042_12015 [Phycisphaeraceae bacterium]
MTNDGLLGMPLWALLVCMIALAGCGSRYDHQALGPDSPQGQQIAGMIQVLRQAKGDRSLGELLQIQSADELTADQQRSLHAVLQRIASAPRAKLVSLDMFGPQVLRAGVRLADASGTTTTVYVLLVVQQDTARWAGPN